MFNFGTESLSQRETLHPKLQQIVDELIKYVNFSIIQGVRTNAEEAKLVASGKSETMNSKHLPDANGKSRAMDIAYYPVDFNNTNQFIYFAGYVMLVAAKLNIKIRWGGDWSGTFMTTRQTLNDYDHFELAEDEV